MLLSNAKNHMSSGQGRHWLVESPTWFLICVTCPPDIYVNLVLNIFTLQAVTQYVKNVFHSFIVLCENEYFLIYTTLLQVVY